jgi:hypothetical protein
VSFGTLRSIFGAQRTLGDDDAHSVHLRIRYCCCARSSLGDERADNRHSVVMGCILRRSAVQQQLPLHILEEPKCPPTLPTVVVAVETLIVVMDLVFLYAIGTSAIR